MRNTIILLLLLPFAAFSQAFSTSEISVTPLVSGTLYESANPKPGKPLVILIAGSGPTDRNGNQPGLTNNSLKLLATALAEKGVSTFSYDKRIIAQMKANAVNESELRFSDMIDDAKSAVANMRKSKKFGKIYIAGHSEGSLVGIVASNGNADGFISVAGAGRTIDKIVIDQVSQQMPDFAEQTREKFQLLAQGKTFKADNPVLGSLFRESVQPYLISWIALDPVVEIAKLKVPVLIVNGTMDMQVKVSEAEMLHKALPKSTMVIIENMNHVLKTIADPSENMKSYSNPSLPVSDKLVDSIVAFITA